MGCNVDRFFVRSGDQIPAIVGRALAKDPRTGREAAINFTTWTSLTFTMEGPRQVTGIAQGDSDGYLTYAWALGDTNTPGTYQGVFRGVSPGGSTQTFPTRGFLTIEIAPL